MVTRLFIPNIESIIDMNKKNIFHPLPNASQGNSDIFETSEEEEEKEPEYFVPISAFADNNIIGNYNSVYRNIYNREEE